MSAPMAERLAETRISLDEAKLRRWLTLLRRPDRLASDEEVQELLELHGRLPEGAVGLALGQAAADLLSQKIEALRAEEGAPLERQMPHLVLRTCFVDGAKLFQAAARLGVSERQLSRERTRAIGLLKAELETARPPSRAFTRSHRAEPIPTIRGFLPRPGQTQRVTEALEQTHLVHVHGPPGIGKTSLVAELATEAERSTRVLWYRFRAGVNDSLTGMLFDLGGYLASEGHPELSQLMDQSLAEIDLPLATRLALRGLGDAPHLMVFDDHHVVETDGKIAGLLDEMVLRLPQVRVIAVGRHRFTPTLTGVQVEISPFAREETQVLLRNLGVDCDDTMLRKVQDWTDGNPHLVKLAASWLRSATADEVAEGLTSLRHQEEVRAFLFSNLTELLDSDDKAVLEAASIFREKFSDDAVAYVSGRTRGAVQDASQRLVRSYAATRSRSGDSAFFHTTIRDYVYDRLDPDRKAELHLRAATWYRRIGDAPEAKHHRKRAAEVEAELT